MEEPAEIEEKSLQQRPPSQLAHPENEWQLLGQTFESLGKAGLAMTVGFSVAAVFCRMVDSGKLKVPSVFSLMAQAEGSEASRTKD